MGIAERQIHIQFSQKLSQRMYAKPLPANVQTIGDWIRLRRTKKNLTSGHVAAKMGIADTVVRSWEEGTKAPNGQQLKELAIILSSVWVRV